MKHESGQDILAAQPIDNSTRDLLINSYRFSSDYVDKKIETFQEAIHTDLDYLEVMVHCTLAGERSYEEDENDTGLRPELDLLATTYRSLLSDPVAKHDFDTAFISDFMLKLGPTNHLRQKDGLDGAFELSHMKRILELDFATLPESEQRPEKRLTEAYIREELALLWSPTSLSRAANLPEAQQAFQVNSEDPNVFTEQDIADKSVKDRWKIIGAQLAEESGRLFSDIAVSPTAELDVQIESLSRSVDMRIRTLRILSGQSSIKDKTQIHDEINAISDDETARIFKAWNDPTTRGRISTGKLYESVALALARQEMIHNNQWDQGIRLALPREDAVSKTIKPWLNRDNVLVNLSTDIIVEDPNGNFVRSYQVKAMSKERYAAKMIIRESEKGKMVYPEQRTEMIFLDEKAMPRG